MEIENDCSNQENSFTDSDKEDEPIVVDEDEHNSKKEAVIITSEPSKLTANPIVVAIHDKSLITSKMQEEKYLGKVRYSYTDCYKKRERNLIPGEKRILLRICQNHPEIYNNSLDTESLSRKRKAWEEIHKKFIAVCPESNDRTIKFLKGCWKRLKKEINVSTDDTFNLDEEMALSPSPTTIYVLDGSVVSMSNTNSPTHPVSTNAHSEENVSIIKTSEGSEYTTPLLQTQQPISVVQTSETPENTFSYKTLQRKTLEIALEAEKEKLEAHKYLKEAQRYAMMAEKERFETELLRKEAARLALKREKDYF